MGDYHLFPQAKASEAAKYTNLPLPIPPRYHPSEAYFTQQSSLSYESILRIRVPSPGLCNPDEIQQIWSRASQHSTFSDNTPALSTGLTRPESLAIIDEFSSCRRRSFNGQLQALLPPAIEYRYSEIPSESVPCRLSSESTGTSGDASPIDAKRGATPDLLQKLSNDLEAFSLAETASVADASAGCSTAPSTPEVTFASPSNASCSPLYQSSSLSSTQSSLILNMEEYTPLITRNHKPAVLTTASGNHKGLPCAQAKYEDCRPPPSIPCAKTILPTTPTQEVSHIDWDDDEDKRGKLARVKKSIGDLRAAAMRTRTEQHNATPKVPEKALSPKSQRIEKPDIAVEHPGRPLAARSATAPTPAQLTRALHSAAPTTPPKQPLPPRPVTRPAISTACTRQSLPPLPIRTASHASNAVTSPTSAPRMVKKPSTRLVQPSSPGPEPTPSQSPQQARRRAVSDGPNRPAFTRSASSMLAKNAASASPSSSSSTTQSQRSSADSGTTTSDESGLVAEKQRAARTAKRRISVMTVSSRTATGRAKRRRASSAATAAGAGSGAGLGSLRRWFRWAWKCTPAVAG